MTAMNHGPTLEDSIEVEAPRDRDWEVISDTRRLAEWRAQVESTRLSDGLTAVELGGAIHQRQPTWRADLEDHGTIVRFDPHRLIAFRIEENWVIWSCQLVETDQRTAVLTRGVDTRTRRWDVPSRSTSPASWSRRGRKHAQRSLWPRTTASGQPDQRASEHVECGF